MKARRTDRFTMGSAVWWLALALIFIVRFLTIPPSLHAADSWVESIRQANLNSFVFITVKAQRANGLIDTFTGSGFIVHPAGYVLTCNHVVPADMSAYTKIEQTGSVGGRYDYPYPLTIIRRDQQADVMLLKLPAKDWRSVKSGAEAQVGSDITALGFPLDQDLVAAPGSITGTDHDGRWLTNANLIPGMSGGPAFDRSGAVIGIVAGGYEEARSLDLLIPITFSTSLLQWKFPAQIETSGSL
jgi:S1-C subfamily serine protease